MVSGFFLGAFGFLGGLGFGSFGCVSFFLRFFGSSGAATSTVSKRLRLVVAASLEFRDRDGGGLGLSS
jgi:hypothetical protein